MKLIEEVKDFFNSYEIMNIMFDKKGIRLDIFEASNKRILQVKIIESPLRGTAKQRSQRNMFCDIKIERNLIKMTFKYKEMKLEEVFIDAVKSIKKNDYEIKSVENQLSISIIEPRIEEIAKIFTLLEPYCRRFKLT